MLIRMKEGQYIKTRRGISSFPLCYKRIGGDLKSVS